MECFLFPFEGPSGAHQLRKYPRLHRTVGPNLRATDLGSENSRKKRKVFKVSLKTEVKHNFCEQSSLLRQFHCAHHDKHSLSGQRRSAGEEFTGFSAAEMQEAQWYLKGRSESLMEALAKLRSNEVSFMEVETLEPTG